MKLKFDVTPEEFSIIRDILEKNLSSHCKVWVFGSRAKGSALFNSDLDVALECKTKIAQKFLIQLKTDFEESRLPYKVDVLDIKSVEPYFKEIIDKQKTPFPLEIKNKVPKLRFKEFSGEWEEKKYGEMYSFFTTNSLSRENLNYEYGKVKNIHYGDIHTKFTTLFDLEKEQVPFVNKGVDISKIKSESYCLEGDLVIADASEDYLAIGKTIEIINLNGEKVIAGLHTFLARPNKHKIALGYISYFLQSWKFRKQIMTIAQGSKVLSISIPRLSATKLTLPTKPEQQKIASFLTAVDRKIAHLNKKKSLLESYKKGLMQKIFSQTIRFKTNDGNNFPDWEEKRLGDTSEIVGGGTPPTGIKKYWDGDIQWFTPTEIKNKYVCNSNRTITRAGLDASSAKLLPKGTLLFSSRATIGEVGIATQECTTNQGFQSFIVNQNHEPEFLYNWILQNKKKFIKGASGSTFLEIGKNEIKRIELNLPIKPEQQKIASFLTAVDRKIEQLNEKQKLFGEFKKALLQQMFV